MKQRTRKRSAAMAALLGALALPMASAKTFLEEDFESVALGPNVDEATAGANVWTKTGPAGWFIDNSGMAGLAEGLGVTEWRGWSFASKDWWATTAGDQRRAEFAKGTGVVAVADPDEWEDLGSPLALGTFNSILSREIQLQGVRPGSLVLKFDSSWRPECCDDGDGTNNQTATVTVSFDEGEPIEVMHWSSNSADANYHDHNPNESVTVTIPNPAGASSMQLNMGLSKAANDWWWAIDNVVVESPDLFFEDFESVVLGDAVNESNDFQFGEVVWSKAGPTGWVTDDSELYKGEFAPDPAPEDPLDWLGVTEWKGWSFAIREWWASVAGDQRRTEFSKGTGIVAIADPDEWDDSGSPGSTGTFNSFVTTPEIPLAGVPPESVLVTFDSSWRPECCDDGDLTNDQTATVTVSFDGGAPMEILHWSSDSSKPEFHDDNSTNETVILPIENPAGATSMKLAFGLTNAKNDWWWAVDNILVSGGGSAILSEVTALPKSVTVVIADTGLNKIDKATLKMSIDGAAVPSTVTTNASFISVIFTGSQAFVPGSEHTFAVTAKDTAGSDVSFTGTFATAPPVLPAELPGPAGGEGFFGVRYIWDGGTQGPVGTTVISIVAAGEDGFEGQIFDTTHAFINHGDEGTEPPTDGVGDGLFGRGAGAGPGDLAYPAEVFDGGGGTDDFVQFSKGTIRVTEAGQYTFGVHSDDGFALRIRGAEFTSVSGAGTIDTGGPDTMFHAADTGDSNTRAVVTLAAGDYDIEFLWWERGGGDFGEVYAAKGAFVNDGDTNTWALIGTEGGLQLVGEPKAGIAVTNFKYNPAANGTPASADITWRSEPDASYVIEVSTDLNEFVEVTDGHESEGLSTTFRDADATGRESYYRVRSE